MIKSILKRDGSTQPFDPNKVNGWGIWAANNLGDKVSWPGVVLGAVSSLPETVTSDQLQERLIKVCLDNDSYSYQKMAGKLYSSAIDKHIKGGDLKSIEELHKELLDAGFMRKLDYTKVDYAKAEKLIDHTRSAEMSHGALHQIRYKYALRDKVSGKEYETAQFVFMRMAMALAETSDHSVRMRDVEEWYNHFSLGRLNCPTPNYVNLGTPLSGFSSCCVYKADDSARSLAIGDHIAYTMTYMSAGIGSRIDCRSVGDPVRKGVIQHQGKLPYYKALTGAVTAQLQNGRGGACTTYYTIYDPEIETLLKLKNPKSVEDKRIRGLDYAVGTNRFFATKAAKREKFFTFNAFTAPRLQAALHSGDEERFAREYKILEEDDSFNKVYLDARDVLLTALNESYETGRVYLYFLDEMNKHTPFREPIYSSNLCTEIFLPTQGYRHMQQLYMNGGEEVGEVAMCTLAGICPSNVSSEEEYTSAAYYALLMIDRCIHATHYELPHVGYTSKSRLNAGVGIVGLAHVLAKQGEKYSTESGKQSINDAAERHMWHLLNASLRLGKELGNAPWMFKTNWPKGYLPSDTNNKAVDDIVSLSSAGYDWEGLRAKIVENGGIRNSVVAAHMPTESSSKITGLPNGLYPIRDLTLIKTDDNNSTYWAATDGEELDEHYERAWDISTRDLIDMYAIVQKWTDQGISADFYRRIIGDDSVTSTEMLKDYFHMVKMGLKSKYYQNTEASSGVSLQGDDADCIGGCTL